MFEGLQSTHGYIDNSHECYIFFPLLAAYKVVTGKCNKNTEQEEISELRNFVYYKISAIIKILLAHMTP
jgi:hypothetical protein